MSLLVVQWQLLQFFSHKEGQTEHRRQNEGE
jgi:hypothetical protein